MGGRPIRIAPGDADLNGVVDGDDLDIWNMHLFMPSGLWSEGDFNGDGWIDGTDFGLWNENRFANPAEPAEARAVLNVFAREPRAPLATEMTAAARLPQQYSLLAVAGGQHIPARQQWLNDDLSLRSLIGNMVWASWPALDSPLGGDHPDLPNSSSGKSSVPRIWSKQEGCQRDDAHVEANSPREALTAVDAFFARRGIG